MTIQFTKMHGLGNDFIVINCLEQSWKLEPSAIARLARRDTGIGFDQCLILEAPKTAESDFFYRIFNANGQEVGQCGNGARCVARFIQYYGLSTKESIQLATPTTTLNVVVNDDETVTVKMNTPLVKPAQIPLTMPEEARLYSIPIDEQNIQVHAINVGNPHAVLVVEDVDKAAVKTLGQRLSEHPLFPEQSNVGFMEIIDKGHLRLRVYERGCGETQACGSGAVAAAAIARLYYHLEEHIQVTVLGGSLEVNWPVLTGPIYLTGPASFVYEGRLLACE